MALNNFFKINLPYGMMKNENNEWACFNREYKPLGCKDSFAVIKDEDFDFCKYDRLTESVLLKLVNRPSSIERVNGEITKVFFYSDVSNPSNFSKSDLYADYFKKLELLSKLKVKK